MIKIGEIRVLSYLHLSWNEPERERERERERLDLNFQFGVSLASMSRSQIAWWKKFIHVTVRGKSIKVKEREREEQCIKGRSPSMLVRGKKSLEDNLREAINSINMVYGLILDEDNEYKTKRLSKRRFFGKMRCNKIFRFHANMKRETQWHIEFGNAKLWTWYGIYHRPWRFAIAMVKKWSWPSFRQDKK